MMSTHSLTTRTLGSAVHGSDLNVAAIGLGCMGMSEFYGTTDEDEAIRTLQLAVDLGVTIFDTADMYGPHTNERLVGRALAPHRDNVVIATKFGIVRDPSNPLVRGINGSPSYVHASCDSSLTRLGIDHIDLYYQHRVDPDVPIEETVGAMKELVDAGKIRRIGLSEASAATIRRAHAVHPITALQTEYSLFTRHIEDDILPTLRELGIGLVPYSPLGRGMLTGDITSVDDLEPGDFRRYVARFTGAGLAGNLALVDAIRRIADDKAVTAAQLALAWVLAQGDDIVPIPGTRRTERLRENLLADTITLTPQELSHIQKAIPVEAVQGARYPDMSSIDS
jgi:aryl-alcohol dehydrogenase-like predicted oxidoreductase